jgi:hypothetical protein
VGKIQPPVKSLTTIELLVFTAKMALDCAKLCRGGMGCKDFFEVVVLKE